MDNNQQQNAVHVSAVRCMLSKLCSLRLHLPSIKQDMLYSQTSKCSQGSTAGSDVCSPAAMTGVAGPTCFHRVPIISASQADESCSIPVLSGQEGTAAVSHDVQLVVMGSPPVLLCTVEQPACLSIHRGALRATVQAALSSTTVNGCSRVHCVSVTIAELLHVDALAYLLMQQQQRQPQRQRQRQRQQQQQRQQRQQQRQQYQQCSQSCM